jgi:hypothetical protein
MYVSVGRQQTIPPIQIAGLGYVPWMYLDVHENVSSTVCVGGFEMAAWPGVDRFEIRATLITDTAAFAGGSEI